MKISNLWLERRPRKSSSIGGEKSEHFRITVTFSIVGNHFLGFFASSLIHTALKCCNRRLLLPQMPQSSVMCPSTDDDLRDVTLWTAKAELTLNLIRRVTVNFCLSFFRAHCFGWALHTFNGFHLRTRLRWHWKMMQRFFERVWGFKKFEGVKWRLFCEGEIGGGGKN